VTALRPSSAHHAGSHLHLLRRKDQDGHGSHIKSINEYLEVLLSRHYLLCELKNHLKCLRLMIDLHANATTAALLNCSKSIGYVVYLHYSKQTELRGGLAETEGLALPVLPAEAVAGPSVARYDRWHRVQQLLID
jgi:hypothetical protein